MKNYMLRIPDETKCTLTMLTVFSSDDCCFWPKNDCVRITCMGAELYYERGAFWATIPHAKVLELIEGNAERYKELRREDQLLPIMDKRTLAPRDAPRIETQTKENG